MTYIPQLSINFTPESLSRNLKRRDARVGNVFSPEAGLGTLIGELWNFVCKPLLPNLIW